MFPPSRLTSRGVSSHITTSCAVRRRLRETPHRHSNPAVLFPIASQRREQCRSAGIRPVFGISHTGKLVDEPAAELNSLTVAWICGHQGSGARLYED